jgi:FKBP-type peptidyl-prolyl cis-trans isomerase
MSRTLFRFLTVSLAGTLSCGMAIAQQSAAPSTQQPAGTPPATTAPKTPKAPAATTAAKKPAPLTLQTEKEKASYAIGVNIGTNMKKDEVDIDPDILARGMKDAMAGNKPLLNDEEVKAVLTNLQNTVRDHQQKAFQQSVEKNKQEGEAFLTANRAKPGVIALPSGLQYKILQPGDGPKPTAGDTVVCNYRGTLIDGTEFDSSYKRGQPATFGVSQVIKGWTEALQLMPVGSKWQLYVPSALAYGERGTPNGGPIGPNETLIFDVELVSIQAKPAPKLEPVAPAGQPQAQPQVAQPQAQPQTKP